MSKSFQTNKWITKTWELKTNQLRKKLQSNWMQTLTKTKKETVIDNSGMKLLGRDYLGVWIKMSMVSPLLIQNLVWVTVKTQSTISWLRNAMIQLKWSLYKNSHKERNRKKMGRDLIRTKYKIKIQILTKKIWNI